MGGHLFDDSVVGKWVRWDGETEQEGCGIACGVEGVCAGEEEGAEREWVVVLPGFYERSV